MQCRGAEPTSEKGPRGPERPRARRRDFRRGLVGPESRVRRRSGLGGVARTNGRSCRAAASRRRVRTGCWRSAARPAFLTECHRLWHQPSDTNPSDSASPCLLPSRVWGGLVVCPAEVPRPGFVSALRASLSVMAWSSVRAGAPTPVPPPLGSALSPLFLCAAAPPCPRAVPGVPAETRHNACSK